ncbi:ferredoxin [Gordonia terrae]
MRVSVDRDRCAGHGQCFSFAPEVYDLDDDGFSVVLELEPEGAVADQAVQGAQACPEHAITIEK